MFSTHLVQCIRTSYPVGEVFKLHDQFKKAFSFCFRAVASTSISFLASMGMYSGSLLFAFAEGIFINLDSLFSIVLVSEPFNGQLSALNNDIVKGKAFSICLLVRLLMFLHARYIFRNVSMSI